jgi:hypothetical protein
VGRLCFSSTFNAIDLNRAIHNSSPFDRLRHLAIIAAVIGELTRGMAGTLLYRVALSTPAPHEPTHNRAALDCRRVIVKAN